jgi:hypothetical protein
MSGGRYKRFGLEQHVHCFAENDIDDPMLRDLTSGGAS